MIAFAHIHEREWRRIRALSWTSNQGKTRRGVDASILAPKISSHNQWQPYAEAAKAH